MGNEKDKDQIDEGKSNRDERAEESSPEKEDVDENDKGEAPGNLKRRSDWFQKRHGGG